MIWFGAYQKIRFIKLELLNISSPFTLAIVSILFSNYNALFLECLFFAMLISEGGDLFENVGTEELILSKLMKSLNK